MGEGLGVGKWARLERSGASFFNFKMHAILPVDMVNCTVGAHSIAL